MRTEATKAGHKRSIELLASPQASSPAKRPHIQVDRRKLVLARAVIINSGTFVLQVTKPQAQTRRPHSLMQQLMSLANERATSAKSST